MCQNNSYIYCFIIVYKGGRWEEGTSKYYSYFCCSHRCNFTLVQKNWNIKGCGTFVKQVNQLLYISVFYFVMENCKTSHTKRNICVNYNKYVILLMHTQFGSDCIWCKTMLGVHCSLSYVGSIFYHACHGYCCIMCPHADTLAKYHVDWELSGP